MMKIENIVHVQASRWQILLRIFRDALTGPDSLPGGPGSITESANESNCTIHNEHFIFYVRTQLL